MIMFPPIDTTKGFFRFESPETVAELLAFNIQLKAFKQKALGHPILPPYELSLTAQGPIFESNPTHISGRRNIPNFILHPAFKQLDGLQLVLTHPLATGDRKWSQVWQGTLGSRLTPSVPPAQVAIKIHQESLFGIRPDIQDIFGDELPYDWRSGAYTAATEAWAFGQMQALQGKIVPWSYGFYKVLLPHGESAFVQVMELVDGIPASEPRVSAKALGLDDAEIWDLADTLGIALHQLHSCGFSHGDFIARNVLLLNAQHREAHARIDVVVVDFGLVCLSDDPNTHEHLLMSDGSGIRETLLEMGVPMETIRSWFEARRSAQPSWRTMFSVIDNYYLTTGEPVW